MPSSPSNLLALSTRLLSLNQVVLLPRMLSKRGLLLLSFPACILCSSLLVVSPIHLPATTRNTIYSTTQELAGDECDRQGQQIWRIEGEGGTAHPSNTRGSALQPGCWPGASWLLGFHSSSQGFARETTPTTLTTTIGLIGKGFPLFFHE